MAHRNYSLKIILWLIIIIGIACFSEELNAQHLSSIYLQTDRQQYVAGDTIWFKGYIQNDLSKKVYVQLWNQHLQLESSWIFPIKGSSVIGALPIDTSIASGCHYLRAYTSAGAIQDTVIDFKKNIIVLKDPKTAITGKLLVHKNQKVLNTILLRFSIDSINKETEDSIQVSIYFTNPDTVDAAISITRKDDYHLDPDNVASIISSSCVSNKIRFPDAKNNTEGLSFNGYVKDWKKIKNKPHTINGFLITKDNHRSFLSFPVDSNGCFALRNLFFWGEAEFQYSFGECSYKGGTPLSVMQKEEITPPLSFINDSLLPYHGTLTPQPLIDNSESIPAAASLQNVTVKARRNTRFLDSIYTSHAFSFPADFGFDLRNEKKFKNIFQYLQFNLPGFSFQGPMFDKVLYKDSPPIFYLDEMEINKDDLLNRIGDRIDQIAYIKVFMSFNLNKVIGMGPPPPAIIVYRKKGYDLESMQPSLNKLTLHGFSPNYPFSPEEGSNRATVLWNPTIEIAPSEDINRLVFRFKKQTKDALYQFNLEGIDKKGRILFFRTTL